LGLRKVKKEGYAVIKFGVNKRRCDSASSVKVESVSYSTKIANIILQLSSKLTLNLVTRRYVIVVGVTGARCRCVGVSDVTLYEFHFFALPFAVLWTPRECRIRDVCKSREHAHASSVTIATYSALLVCSDDSIHYNVNTLLSNSSAHTSCSRKLPNV